MGEGKRGVLGLNLLNVVRFIWSRGNARWHWGQRGALFAGGQEYPPLKGKKMSEY